MKTKNIISLLILTVVLNSCFFLTVSLHPFYLEKNVIIDDAILGHWNESDSTHWEIRPDSLNSKKIKKRLDSYIFRHIEGQKHTDYCVHLFKHSNSTYCDFLITNSDSLKRKSDLSKKHLLPVHSLAKLIRNDKNRFQLRWFYSHFLSDLLKENKINIEHVRVKVGKNKELVLTANSKKLQKFIHNYNTIIEDALKRDDVKTDDAFAITNLSRTKIDEQSVN